MCASQWCTKLGICHVPGVRPANGLKQSKLSRGTIAQELIAKPNESDCFSLDSEWHSFCPSAAACVGLPATAVTALLEPGAALRLRHCNVRKVFFLTLLYSPPTTQILIRVPSACSPRLCFLSGAAKLAARFDPHSCKRQVKHRLTWAQANPALPSIIKPTMAIFKKGRFNTCDPATFH